MHAKDLSYNWLRKPAVAGQFYPDHPETLRTFLEEVMQPVFPKRAAKAIFAPHAGYSYSGKFAGEIYRRIEPIESAIILCPNHTGNGPRISVWAKGVWQTPLGELFVDDKITSSLLALVPELLSEDKEAHLFEHAIEVQLPFLQMLNKSVRIVPIVLSHLTIEECKKFGFAIAKCVGIDRALIIASTDMSHYVPAEVAKMKDSKALEQCVEMNATGLYNIIHHEKISMCGYIPTACTIFAAAELGCKKGEIIAYGNSGSHSGDYDSVVGYASGWFL